MIHIIGDLHGDLRKLLHITEEVLPTDGCHYLLCCGDFGFLMDHTGRLSELERFDRITFLFIDGNHEAFPVLNKLAVTEWNGAKVSFLHKNVLHVKRGEVLCLEGKTIFCLGGAASPDRTQRLLLGLPWYTEELPTPDEIANAWSNLARCDYRVDAVVTHTAPGMVQRALGYRPLPDEAFFAQTLDDILRQTTVHHGWYFGHFHEDKELTFLGKKFTCCLNKYHRLREE